MCGKQDAMRINVKWMKQYTYYIVRIGEYGEKWKLKLQSSKNGTLLI
jgi:hypothetical protein